MKVVVVIPARGGSKSLPHKNILPLNNKPLISYSIEYALNCSAVADTLVSTDSHKIADIAKNCGAQVPFLRPSELAEDDTRDYPVLRHALDFFEAQNIIFDLYVLLRPTSPMRPANLIERCIEMMESDSRISSIRSMAPIKEHPYRAWRLCEDNRVVGFVDDEIEPYNIPRQELPELLFQTGDIEVIRRSTLLGGSISGDCVHPILIKHDEMVDIDSQSDFDVATKRMSDG